MSEGETLHRGRLIDHLGLVVRDIAVSKTFYTAALGALGLQVVTVSPEDFYVDELFVSSTVSGSGGGKLTGRIHLAFQAPDHASVQRFFEAAVKAGGTPNGEPGERPYHPGYYAAFVLDPDGNNIEAVYHGPHERSAASVKITF